MRLFVIISVLVSVQAFGQYNPIVDHPLLAQVQTIHGRPLTNSVNLWYDFEQDGVAASDFDAHDHGNGSVTVVDTAGSLRISTSGEQSSWPGGVVESGTRGLAVTLTNGVDAYFNSGFAAPGYSNISVGFWMYAKSYPSNDSMTVFSMVNTNGSTVIGVSWSRSSGNNTIGFQNSYSATNISISADGWYWITAGYARSNLCSFAVYHLDGTQVSSTVSLTDVQGYYISSVKLGAVNSPDNNATTLYWDDLMIDYSTATFPLGPNF